MSKGTLATVRAVRAWMASHAGVEEWRESRARAGAMPRFLTEAHDWAVERTLTLVEVRAVETRMRVPESGRMVRVGGQKAVIAKGRLTPALQKGLSEGIGNAR